jgi:hypothetical protein
MMLNKEECTLLREIFERHADGESEGLSNEEIETVVHTIPSLLDVLEDKNYQSPSAGELLEKGGKWLGAARNWLKWHKRNGSQMTWGSNDVLEGPFTVREVEALASEVAAEAMRPQPTEEHVSSCLRARWKAEQELSSANARIKELEGLVSDAVKYIVEDKAVTPGVTRLARWADRARTALAKKEGA